MHAAKAQWDDPTGTIATIMRDVPSSADESDWGRRRQLLLDALPIASGIFEARENCVVATATNSRLDNLLNAGLDGVDAHWLNHALEHFLATGDESLELEWQREEVGQRHFTVRLHRIAPTDNTARCVASFVDRTAQVETERSLRTEMLHDSLTGLPNRLAFNEAVDEAIAGEEDKEAYAVLIVDLKRFSRINECMGSMAGDELIITVARRMMASLRDGDILARLGGNEFGILLRLGDGPGDALHAAKRISAALASPIRLSELEIRIDCAVGCALLSRQVAGAGDLIRNAQVALKRAKNTGKVEVYQPGEVNAARRRFSLETQLRRAIDADELSLHFQPLVDLDKGGISGFEALARWTPPGGAPISPVEFIPVAEECGLIVPLGRWVMDAAARTLADWDRQLGAPSDLYFSVNVSAVQLQRDDVAGHVASVLADHRIAGSRITLELTESSIIADPERAKRVVVALKDLDAAIAMDDFGTGYSSLAFLQKLPIDILKIDRSFVSGMLGDRDAVAIVRAVLSLADALGMRTTAEGIETVELAQTLTALGCTTGQGYYWSKPLPADQALDYYRARHVG
ncbi:EAL domain-containing protein [Sphingomonas naphthae]|uniref:EAL domain-containing protein n=1 Tax=Sphingomonas naphthae TaxID=1813468 RepID=A0ABY7TH08_9SPHN|nr:EAL domain-containing protein [Sphingomonas naphthae]WCT72498.1 EAL domain-containing protein [Sphingomonas naphthae]